MAKPGRRGRGAITIEDVAHAAGVSAMTVSRVINQVANVRESTRAAVLEAIDRLNYSPNTAARSLAGGEATHIGLLYANPSAAYLAQFLIGALHAARSAGVHLVIESCESEDVDEQADVTRRLATSDVEGVVLPPPQPSPLSAPSRGEVKWIQACGNVIYDRNGVPQVLSGINADVTCLEQTK